MAAEKSQILYPGIEHIEGTYLGGKYHLVIVHRDQNPNLHIAIHYESSFAHVDGVMKKTDALVATEGIFWNGRAVPPMPYGDVLANGVNHRGRLSMKRYYFGVTNSDTYVIDWLDAIGKLNNKILYGLKPETIAKRKLKHALGGIVGLIRNGNPIPAEKMGYFSADSQYIITGKQSRLAFGWTPQFMKFCIPVTGPGSHWTAEETRDFFINELPAAKGYHVAGAVMPDTGSYTYLKTKLPNKNPTWLSRGTGPSGKQQNRFNNISFVIVKEVT